MIRIRNPSPLTRNPESSTWSPEFTTDFDNLKLRANERNNSQHCCAYNVAYCWVRVVVVCTRLQQLPATCNRVYKRTQHVTSSNVGSCWPTMLRPFARGFTGVSDITNSTKLSNVQRKFIKPSVYFGGREIVRTSGIIFLNWLFLENW